MQQSVILGFKLVIKQDIACWSEGDNTANICLSQGDDMAKYCLVV